jgi:hypothetical protein
MKELLEAVFSVWSVLRLCNGDQLPTVALRIVRGDGKGTQCPGVYLDHLVPGGYKYGDLALQQLQLVTDPSSRQRGRYKITNPQLSKENFKEKEKFVAVPRWVPDTKTDWPTDCRS